MRERVLAFVRAIVKSTHLNMNKSCAVGSLACLSVHSLIRMSVRPFVRPAQRRRRLAHPFARPTRRSVLHMCIYGLLNGGRLQIRRAVNQTSNGPHRARTIPLAPQWALLPARAVANKILGAPGAGGAHPQRRRRRRRRSDLSSSSRGSRASRGGKPKPSHISQVDKVRLAKEIMTRRVEIREKTRRPSLSSPLML